MAPFAHHHLGATGTRALTRNFLRRFTSDRRGNVAMMFTFAIIPLLLLIGAAVDFGQATRVRSQLQNATDVAALSVARDGLSQPDSALAGIADKYLKANWQLPYAYKVDKLKFDRPTVTAEVGTTVKVPTTFLQIMGINQIPVHAHSVTKGLGVEVALVLDTSGSMSASAGQGGSKISALRDASKALLKVFYGDATVSQRFAIGIVPFAASVNVGPGFKNAAWIDTGKTPAVDFHDEDYTANMNRFDLFSGSKGMKNVSWAGCVMTRAAPYDTNDAAPSSGSTLFVPWFAPDEPDGDNYKDWGSGQYDWREGSYTNSYLDDEGGDCTGSSTNTKAKDAVKQKRICKYKGETPQGGGKGPNYRCDSTAITALTPNRAPLEKAVDALEADGNTNILEGFMWGWRVLSNTEPFNQGKAYNAPNNRKIIILMTDGQNNYSGRGNMNMSEFFAYGFSKHQRAGAATSDNNKLTTYLDARTQQACAAAKAKGIIVYSIAFGADAAASQNLLKGCASDPKYYFAPQSSADLKPVFIKIAESINALRIAQ